jgi:hypothetical protein
MDIITKIAEDFSNRNLRNVAKPYEVIDLVTYESLRIENPLDRIMFLNFLIESNRSNQERHFKECENKDNCPTLKNHEIISYFLTQELEKLGFHKETDSFSNLEKYDLDQKLDRILEELKTIKEGQETVKDGQEITYEDLSIELSEIKDLYYLGKKHWKQIWIGKIFEMTISGIISRTLSQRLLNEAKETFLYLSNK